MNARPISEVAEELRLSPQRVRILASRGLLDAEKVGSQWLVKDVGLARRSHPGRPLSAVNAWAVLALLSGEDPVWLDPSVKSRLRRRLREPGWLVRAIGFSQPRAAVEKLRVLPGDLAKLEVESSVIKSGLSANYSELNVLPSRESLDAYVSQPSYAAIERRFQPLLDPSRPNLILRIPKEDWVLQHPDRVPLAVAAADLLHAEDPRARRGAQDLMQRFAT